MQRITQACAYPIALIVAPAGYGKTVALRQYLESVDSPQVRFDVRPEHETLPGFVRGFAEAAAAFAPEMRSAMGDALRGPSTAAQLAEWAATHLREFHGIIAIDDLHLASSNNIASFLRILIERLALRVRWMFVSRVTPELPIATWMTYGQMDIAVDEHDLAFTVDEAKEAGHEAEASTEELRHFIEMTGGWATALSFAMRSRIRTTELQAIGHTTREMVYRYLAEQVYEQLTDVERQLLHIAAYLPAIDVDLLVAAGFSDAYSLLEQIRKRTAFLSIEGERRYRCHDLFREFLQHRVELMGVEVSKSVQCKAAFMLWKAGQLAAALAGYTAAGSSDGIKTVLQDVGLELMDKGLWHAASSALDRLPDAVKENDVQLLAVQAAIDKSEGRFESAELRLNRVISKTSDLLQRAKLTIRLAHLGFEQGRDVVPLLEPMRSATLPKDILAEIFSYMLVSHASQGRAPEADALFPLVLRYAAEVESDLLRARLLYRCAVMAIVLERRQCDPKGLLSRALEVTERNGFHLTRSAALVAAAQYALFNEQYFECSQLAKNAVEAAKRSGDVFSVQIALALAANSYAEIGEFALAESALSELPTWHVVGRGRADFVSTCKSMALACEGRFAAAYEAIGASPNFYNFDRVQNLALRAAYAFSAGMQDEAVKLCVQVQHELTSENYLHDHAKGNAEIARLVASLIFHLCGQVQQARAMLDLVPLSKAGYCTALSQFINKFVSKLGAGPDDLLTLCNCMRAHGRGGIAHVLQVVLFHSRMCGQSPGLTRAEVDVLVLLNRGQVPKQIAASTRRSVHTVRTLIQRATEKLGCSGRQEALAVARQTGLLEPVQQDGPAPGRKASEL